MESMFGLSLLLCFLICFTAGADEDCASIHVSVAPAEIVAFETDNIHFNCSTNASQPYNVTWFKNGALPTSSRWVPRNLVLYYRNQKIVNHNSSIECVIDTAQCRVEGRSRLYIRTVPRIVAQPTSVGTVEGGHLFLECRVEGGPPLSVRWFKDGAELEEDDRVKVSLLRGLNMTNVSRSDAGNYSCQIQWTASQLMSSSAEVTVQYPPNIVVLPKNMSVSLFTETELTLDCLSEGNPTPSVTWYKDDVVLSGQTLQNGSLHLTSVTPTDSGVYRCSATNVVGSQDSPSVFINAQFPSLAKPVLRVVNKTASLVTIMWTSPDPDTYVSYKLTLSLPGSPSLRHVSLSPQTIMYTFIGLDPYTEYTVGLTAATEFTTVNADLLKVTTLETAPEDEPVNVTAVSITSTTAILEWGEPITPNGVVVDYHLSYTPGNVSFVVNQSTFVELEDLTPFTQYTVSVRARTQGGVGPPAVVEFQTLEGVPVAPPTIVDASVINSTTATISWEELSTVDLRGNLHHYVVIVEHQGTQVKRIETNETTVPVTGLHRFAQHHITLYAATLGGAGPNVTVSLTTLPTAPDNQSVIVNLTATPLSHSSILITWSPPVKGVNSNITGYQVTWETDTVNLTVEDLQSELYSTRVTYNLTDLTPFTNYTLNVRVLTALGIGAEGDAVTVATYEYTPSKPENISVLNINQPKAAILLSWQPPLKPNGVITMYQYIIGSSVANVSAENMSVMIGDLDYYTDYNVTVVAFTSAGPGEGGTEMFRSSEGPPSAPPTMISLTRVTSQSVEFSWFPPPPGTVNGVLRSYQVEFDRTNHTVPDGTSFQRSGLSPYTNYSFRVAAVTTKVGTFSDISSVRTNFSDDGGPPDNLTAVPVGDSSLNVSWLPPLQPNGPIDGYVISIAIFDGSAMGQSFTARASTLFHLFERLQTHTEYEVTVRASSDEIGEWKNASTIYVFTTNQSVPGLVVSLPSEVLSDSSVVKWTPPTFPNGRILSYRVTCPEQAMKVVHPPNNYITCGQLQPNTTYTASVQAVNYVGDGQTAMITFTTACDYAPPNIDARSEESVRIHLKSCPVNPTFGYVLVVVRKLDGSSTLRPLKSYTIDELVSLTQQPSSRQRRRRGRRQASGPQPYISANLTLNQLASFVLGDGQEYGGYENRVLDSGATYQSTLYGENPTTGKVVVYPSTTFNLTSLSDSPSSPPNIVLYVIIGIAAFISLIILVVVGIIFFVLLSLCRSPSKDNASGGFSRQASFRMSLKKAKVFDPLEVFRGTHSWPSLESHPPVPLSGFHSRMTILQADSNFHFLQEYEAIDIPEQSTYSTEAAVTMVNASKNRYTNIIPFDHSRVKLSPIKGLDGSDYINANFCDGYMKPRAYIATQGPLRNTVEDFWRLVWEQQSYIIVMLTNVQERGKEKCAEYWPLGEMECFGNIDISLESVVALADFTIRTFNVSKTGNPRDVRKVQQFQFTAWPDHGVPMFATSMLAFIRRVQAAMQELPEGAGPMIVHCSAGVGRTGTFIVIDSMTQKIKGGGDSVDVFGHVTLLRTQRNFMVQTEDQYFFIYEAIAEYITCGNTECDMEELPSHVDHLVSIGDGEESAFIELEFKHLALEKNDPNRFGFANESFNKQKNRFVNILPFDTNRVTLEGIRGVQGSDYINASFIDSYQRRKAFIACQAPLENTVDDFWRMIWQHRSPIIVVLTQLMEQGVEQCTRYWPSDQPIQCGDISVEPLVGRNTSTYSYREFRLVHDKSSSSHVVRHFHFHCWPEVGVPSTGIPLVELIKEVTKMYNILNCSDPVTVHCSSGVGRTGVFIALSIIMERMKLECVVDVFQTVKMLRIQRPAMVQTLEQYQFCYDTTVEVLSRIDSFKSLLRNSSGSARLLRGNSSEATTFLPKSPTPGASYPES